MHDPAVFGTSVALLANPARILLATAQEDGFVHVSTRDVVHGQEIASLRGSHRGARFSASRGEPSEALRCAWADPRGDGRSLICGTANGLLTSIVYSEVEESFMDVPEWSMEFGPGKQIYALATTADRTVVAGYDDCLEFVDLDRGTRTRDAVRIPSLEGTHVYGGVSRNPRNEVTVFDVAAQRSGLWAACSDGTLRFLDPRTSSASTNVLTHTTESMVSSCGFHPERDVEIVSACGMGTIKIWDARRPASPTIATRLPDRVPVYSARFGDARTVLAVFESTIAAWRVDSNEFVELWRKETGFKAICLETIRVEEETVLVAAGFPREAEEPEPSAESKPVYKRRRKAASVCSVSLFRDAFKERLLASLGFDEEFREASGAPRRKRRRLIDRQGLFITRVRL